MRALMLTLAATLLFAGCGNKNENKTTGGAGTAKPVADTPAPTGTAVIKGVIKFAGDVPEPEKWAGASNADCKGLHGDTIQLVKVKDGKLEDAFVYVKSGLPKGSYPTPS